MTTDHQKVKRRWKSFERKIAKTFSVWSGVALLRVPMSGAWGGQDGDITSRYDAYFPFVIECKTSASFSYDSILNESKDMKDWLNQARDQASRKTAASGSVHLELLVFSKPRYPFQIAIPFSFALKLGLLTKAIIEHIPLAMIHSGRYSYIVMRLDYFIDHISYTEAYNCCVGGSNGNKAN